MSKPTNTATGEVKYPTTPFTIKEFAALNRLNTVTARQTLLSSVAIVEAGERKANGRGRPSKLFSATTQG